MLGKCILPAYKFCMDKLTSEQRSRNMAKIKSKNTRPEMTVRSLLHTMGFRFRLHVSNLPGKPDIVLPRFRVVIFVNGCFWHGHEGCSRAKLPATRAEFWSQKIERNKLRDAKVVAALEAAGYRCLILWECCLKDQEAIKLKLRNFLTQGIEEMHMAKHVKSGNSEELLRSSLAALHDFENMRVEGKLRSQVLHLLTAAGLLRRLGSSLMRGLGAPESAKGRILAYLREHVGIVIAGEELMIVAGISEYARRIRELRIEDGWPLISGVTINNMEPDEITLLLGEGHPKLKPDQYVLLADKPDSEASARWKLANEIRREPGSMRDKILKFLRQNVGKEISGEELRYVADNKTEWARRVRELRTEFGWPIVTRTNGRPDLPVGMYVLEEDRQAPEHDRKIPDKTYRDVLVRDDYSCRDCGWTRSQWNPDDPRHLEVHHIHAHADGGSNESDNLLTLCNICHDVRHRK